MQHQRVSNVVGCGVHGDRWSRPRQLHPGLPLQSVTVHRREEGRASLQVGDVRRPDLMAGRQRRPCVKLLAAGTRLGDSVGSMLVALAASCLCSGSTQAAEDVTASFNRNCAGCHQGGGNVVAGGATLRLPDLQKNKVVTPEAIYQLVYYGRGKMPGYGMACTPKGKCTFGPRLGDDEIQALSDFVVERAEQGWK